MWEDTWATEFAQAVWDAGGVMLEGARRQVDVIGQLKRFAELRDKGIPTEEEFAAQKAKLLGT